MKTSKFHLTGLLGAAVAAGLVLGTSGIASAQFSSNELKCRQTIAKETSKLTKTAAKAITGCHKSRLKGKVDSMVDCNSLADPGTDPKGKVTKAEGKFIDKLSGSKSKCAGIAPVTLQFFSCPAPCDVVVPSLTTLTQMADCLICVAESEVEAMTTSSLDTPTPPLPSKDDDKCHGTIAKEQSKLVSTVLKERTKCQNAAEAGGATDTSSCAGMDPSGKIQQTRTKGEGKIADKCGPADLTAVSSCATTNTTDLAACVFNEGDAAGDSIFQTSYGSGSPTWTAVQNLFISTGCASGFCHGNSPGGGQLGNLADFDLGYDELLVEGTFCATSAVTNRVVANDPANSFLIQKLQGTHDCGSQMPLGGTAYTPEQIQIVIDWINDGAPKN